MQAGERFRYRNCHQTANYLMTINQAGTKPANEGMRAPASRESYDIAISPRLAFHGNHDDKSPVKKHTSTDHTSLFYKYL